MTRDPDQPPRPDRVFDPMLQHERTALAWERTAIAMMVAGALLARHAATVHPTLILIGIAGLVFGGGLIVWTGRHYDELHGPLRSGQSPVHPRATRVVGVSTIVFLGLATLVAIAAG